MKIPDRLFLIVALWFFAVPVFSQEGTLAGKVVGATEEDPLVGVNVVLKGTLKGTSTNLNGDFVLKQIPAGEYTVNFSLVGYQRETRTHITVEGGKTTTLNVRLTVLPIQTDQVVVTASKREQSLQEVPVSVSVMDAKNIAYRNSISVDDALRYIPGVNMTESQVNIRGSSGYNRGVGSRVLMLVDGIPFITGDTGELNFETIPVGEVDRIEVVKGASSALYGSSALGGVINVITRPVSEQPETRLRLYGGIYSKPSYPSWDWGGGDRFNDGQSVSHSRKFDNLGMSLFVSRMADDGYRQNDSRRRYNGYLKLKNDISPQEALSMTFDILHQEHGSFLWWKDLNHALVPPDSNRGDVIHSTRFFVSSQYTHIVSEELLYNVRTMWFHNHFDDVLARVPDRSTSDVLRAELQSTWKPDALNIMTFGIEGNYDGVNSNLFSTRSGGGFAAYAQDELQITDQFKATAGARFDYQHLDSLGSNSQLNPKLGLVYMPSGGTTLRASYGRGFRTPAIAEAFTSKPVSGLVIVPNPNLKPEKSSSYEAGASHAFGDIAVLDVAVFQNDFSNLIESGFNANGQGQFNNVTRARIQGAEISTRSAFLEGNVALDIGYTYVYPRDLTLNDILKYRPRHLFYASTTVHAGLLTAGIDYRFISKVERIDEEFVRLGLVKDGDNRGNASITDLRLGADFTGLGYPWNVALNINNIFQYNYVEIIGNLMPPRNFVLVVEARI